MFYSYGWAMSQFMPKDGFLWYEGDHNVKNILKLLENCKETSNIGFALEVDIAYPQSLHDAHNDLPYLPERMVPPGSKINKLVANLQYKKNYVVHYMALKQALKAGLILEKVIDYLLIHLLLSVLNFFFSIRCIEF